MLSPVLALCLPPWCPTAKALPPRHGKSLPWAALLDRIDWEALVGAGIDYARRRVETPSEAPPWRTPPVHES